MTFFVTSGLTNCVSAKSFQPPKSHSTKPGTKQKARTLSPCLLRLDKATASTLLQRRVRRLRTARRKVTDHTRLVGVESARSGSVRGNRVAVHGITRLRRAAADCSHRELITARGAPRQNAVDQVSRGRACTRTTCRRRNLSKRRRIAY